MMTQTPRYVRRLPGEKYKAACVQTRVKHPPSIMIWASISAEGPGPLYFVEGSMNALQYIKVLQDTFLPSIQDKINNGDVFYFMQDNAPCHTAKKVKKFVSDHNLPLLPWPGNSPDLNPIENVWHVLKTKLKNSPVLTKKP